MNSSSLLNWPDSLSRTDDSNRESTNKFGATYRQTKSELKTEFDRMGVDEWRIDDVTGSGGDPGVVVRWVDDGAEHAVAADKYTAKRDNLRSIYLWVKETRKRSERPVETARSSFASARLPSGEEGSEEPVSSGYDPYEVLGVSRSADYEEIRDVFREKVRKYHPDGSDPDVDELNRVKTAWEEINEGDY